MVAGCMVRRDVKKMLSTRERVLIDVRSDEQYFAEKSARETIDADLPK